MKGKIEKNYFLPTSEIWKIIRQNIWYEINAIKKMFQRGSKRCDLY